MYLTTDLGETLTAAEELYRYRQYLIAAKSARAANNPIDEQRAMAEAERYRRMYLSRGDADLSRVDRIVLALGSVPSQIASGVGTTLASALKPLGPYLLLGVVALYLWKKR